VNEVGRLTGGVLEQAVDWHQAGQRVALATVVRTWGSAPRRPGSHMAIEESGHFVGSVSGGCVEAAVVSSARQVMATGVPQLLEFGVTDEEAWAVGLACGGQVDIWVERVD